MAIGIDKKEKMENGDEYWFNPKHRKKGNKNASIWIIKYAEELALCKEAIELKLISRTRDDKNIAYNLKIDKDSGKKEIIGTGTKGEKLKLAKFDNSVSRSTWHGYPANHIANCQDIPTNDILDIMFDNELISKLEMRKILRGQKI